MKKKRIGLKIAVALLLTLVLTVVGYLLYVVLTYSRLPDKLTLEIDGDAPAGSVSVGEEYTIVTQNLGFGAYTRDFTFFMDGGTESWAESPQSVEECISKAAATVSSCNPDFILFQEVDLDSTRSYHCLLYTSPSPRD